MSAADSGGLDAVFRPGSIAVVGAGRARHQIGHQIVRNLVDGGFAGPVYPVNPKAKVVHSMHCYPRVGAIPGEVDLAVIVVPAAKTLEAVRDCGSKGVRALVVISAGFAETGPEGRKRQDELVELCRERGMRLVGPNCMGVLNTDPVVSMNATFAATTPTSGGAAFLSQSGALGEAILADARSLRLGVSMFASVGNRADVSPPDLLEYWERDPRTEQILLYLEAFGDPERFMRAARRVSRSKPVLVVKSGRTPQGARAAISHTGSLAGSEAAVDSLLSQCGVLRVDSMKDLFLLASAVQTGKLPGGPRVAIVTNAGGPAILATDVCAALGLELAKLSPATLRKLRAAVPVEASLANPVDLIANADAERFDHALRAVRADRSVDMIIAIFVSPVMIDAAAVARVLVDCAANTRKPMVTCLLGKQEGEAAVDILRNGGVPNYRFPEEAAVALSGLHRLKLLRERPDEAAPKFRARRSRARAVVEQALHADHGTLKGTALFELLQAYGIPAVPGRVEETLEGAVEAAEGFGWPVVMKIEDTEIEHKSDLGGVVLDLRNAEELAAAWGQLEERFAPTAGSMRVLVQPFRTEGVEVFFGAATDAHFGRMLAFGIGGVHVEVFKDVVFRLHPLNPADAREMVQGIRGHALLEGARGKPPVDQGQLVEILLRLSQLLRDIPEIEELDLNPFLAAWDPAQSCVLDARVRLAAV